MRTMRKITDECWEHIPAGTRVENGYGRYMTAPSEEGLYTLYELADEKNCHVGWRWEKEVEQ